MEYGNRASWAGEGIVVGLPMPITLLEQLDDGITLLLE